MCATALTEQNKLSVKSLLSRTNCCERLPDSSSSEEAGGDFFFPPPPSGYMAKCDWTFLAAVALLQESHISQGSPLLLQQDTHCMKNVEWWRERPDKKWKVDFVVVWTEGRVMSLLQDLHSQPAGIEYFFPLFLCLEKNIYITKNSFYACYGWPSVCTSWASGKGSKKTEGDLWV